MKKSCVIRYKDTNLKAIHNHPIQRYKFESNSQPRLSAMRDCLCCVIRYKDTNLKAIHNPQQSARAVPAAVSSDTKIQI